MAAIEVQNGILKETLGSRFASAEEPADLDVYVAEFGHVTYRVQASEQDPQSVLLSIGVPRAPQEFVTSAGLPLGAVEAVQDAFSQIATILSAPEQGYNLTLRLDLTLLPPEPQARAALAESLSALRSVVMGAPLAGLLRPLSERRASDDAGILTAVLCRPDQVFFAMAKGTEKVTVVWPMHFPDPQEAILAINFLKELEEGRHSGGVASAPACAYTPPTADPPLEVREAPAQYLCPNAGFVSFVVQRAHVEGPRLGRTVWALCTFYDFVAAQLKATRTFLHTQMRRRIGALNQLLVHEPPVAAAQTKRSSSLLGLSRLDSPF